MGVEEGRDDPGDLGLPPTVIARHQAQQVGLGAVRPGRCQDGVLLGVIGEDDRLDHARAVKSIAGLVENQA